MPKPTQSEQLDRVVSALVGPPGAPVSQENAARRYGPSFGPVIEVISALRDLPRTEFRERLKANLDGRATMASSAPAVSEHRNVATPYLAVKNAAAAIEFYKRAFGATESMRLMQPDGRIGHAEIDIGGARIMLADEFPEAGFRGPESLGGSPIHIHFDVADVDAVASRAIAAGAKLVRPVADQFYGDRSGQISDPFGYTWVISTRKERMSAAEMQRRLDAVMKPETSSAAEPAKVNPIREGFKTVTPYIIVSGAPELVDFLKLAFGAVESFRSIGSAGGLHCELKIGDSMVMVGGGFKYTGPVSPTAFDLAVPDVDAVYQRAIEAGATPLTPVTDQSYGARGGSVTDLAGNQWHIATPMGPRENRPADMIPLPSQSVTVYLYPVPASAGIEFFRKAFGAEEMYKAQSPEGRIYHAQLRIGNSMLELGDANGPYQPMPTTMFLYVEDADAWYERAIKAGATSMYPPADQPYGDRLGGVKDPFGNTWYIATHVRDVAG
jgi:PhnB protein